MNTPDTGLYATYPLPADQRPVQRIESVAATLAGDHVRFYATNGKAFQSTAAEFNAAFTAAANNDGKTWGLYQKRSVTFSPDHLINEIALLAALQPENPAVACFKESIGNDERFSRLGATINSLKAIHAEDAIRRTSRPSGSMIQPAPKRSSWLQRFGISS